MDNAVLKIKKGQGITIIIEGYEDHASLYDYDDVFQIVLQQAQQDLNNRRNEKWRKKNENGRQDAYAGQAQLADISAANIATVVRK